MHSTRLYTSLGSIAASFDEWHLAAFTNYNIHYKTFYNFFFQVKNSYEGIEQNNVLALLKTLTVISNKFTRDIPAFETVFTRIKDTIKENCYLVFVQILHTASIENVCGRKREFKFWSQGFKGLRVAVTQYESNFFHTLLLRWRPNSAIYGLRFSHVKIIYRFSQG